MKCWTGGLLAAWVVQIFGTSALIILSRGSEVSLAAIWAVADDVAPLAKIGFILGLTVLTAPVRRRALGRPVAMLWWAGASIAALVLTLALLPQPLSRGFGIGLTGSRFDAALLPSYLLGALLAGLAGAWVHMRCQGAGPAVR